MTKKLTKRQRKKDLPGVNLAAIHRRLEKLEKDHHVTWTGVRVLMVEMSEVWAAIQPNRKGKKA